MKKQYAKNSGKFRRRSAGYLLVLGAAMLLTVIGYASIMTARINTRMVTGTNDWAEAGALAIAAAELAPLLLLGDAWRDNIQNGVAVEFEFGGGTASIIYVDEVDGDFSTGPYDPIRAYGMATVGDAVRVRSVQLTPNVTVPLSSLEVAVHCSGGVSGTLASITSNQTISTEGSLTGFLFNVNADVEYMGTAVGPTVSGTLTKTLTARGMPDPESVFQFYINNGTSIPVSALPVSGGNPTIEAVALTSRYNPFTGEVNQSGIYVIDCEGQAVKIKDARLNATLVLLNAPDSGLSDKCAVLGQVSWQPAIPNYPALLVQGHLDFSFEGGTQLSELSLGVNLNLGEGSQQVLNVDLDGSYPSRIKGLIYASSDVSVLSENAKIQGVLLSGGSIDISSAAESTIDYSNRFYRDPPPGFGAGPYEPVVGTWRWDEAPCGIRQTDCTLDSDCCSGNCNEVTGKCTPNAVVSINLPI